MSALDFLIFVNREYLAKIGIDFTNTHLLGMERVGRFPKRVRLGRFKVAWVKNEIDAWVRDRIEERGAK